MKNTFFLAIIALFIGVSASAQSTVDSIAAKYKLLPMPAPLTLEKKFPVIGAYALTTDATAAGVTTSATTSTATGTTQTDSTAMTTTTAVVAEPSVTITLDSVNKGIVWVEGLPQGKFKAYLKKSPTTYRILAQKTNLGKQIPEGTLYYDVEANALNIAIGGGYNEEDPIAVFGANVNSNLASTTTSTDVAVTKPKATSKSKSKSKVTFYTASKVITEPAVEAQGGGTTQDQQ